MAKGDVVGVKITYDDGDKMVYVAATSVNGLAVVNPQAAVISFDQWIEIACKLQLKQIELRKTGQTTSTALKKPRIYTG